MLQLFQVGDQPATVAFWRAQTSTKKLNPGDFVRSTGDWFGGGSPSIPYESFDRSPWATAGLFKINFDDLLSSNWNLGALNTIREVLNEQLDYFCATIDCSDSFLDITDYPEGTWTFDASDWAKVFTPGYEHLDAFVDRQCPQSGSTVVTCFDYVYQAGELVYESFIDLISWINAHFHSLVYERRLVQSLISELFRSGKGTAAVTSLFVNERSWYLHHSAHPPEVAVKAVDGRFAATVRRARFRPQPA
jgi:hypothetical protein